MSRITKSLPCESLLCDCACTPPPANARVTARHRLRVATDNRVLRRFKESTWRAAQMSVKLSLVLYATAADPHCYWNSSRVKSLYKASAVNKTSSPIPTRCPSSSHLGEGGLPVTTSSA